MTKTTKINIKDSIVIKKSSIPKTIERALRGRSRTHVKTIGDLGTYINFINMVISTNAQFSENTILQSISLLIKVSVFRLNEWKKIHQKILNESNNPQIASILNDPNTTLKTVLDALKKAPSAAMGRQELPMIPFKASSLSSPLSLSSKSISSSSSSSSSLSSSSTRSIMDDDFDIDDFFPMVESFWS